MPAFGLEYTKEYLNKEESKSSND